MFDIYLYVGCLSTPPDLDDFVEQIPALSDPGLRAKLQAWRPGGFLGLALAEDTARTLLDRLAQAQAHGFVVPSAYREPKLSMQEAQVIAERAIAELREPRYTECTLRPVHYVHVNPWWWTFAADCKERQEQGFIPGTVSASIDKLDGHIWRPEEVERRLEQQ